VTGIRAALVPNDHAGSFGQVIDDFALALVTPLGADDD
jgi:hypothetical protein